jgi:MHS family proline/betaine transporter-like MFS transporter
LKNYKRVFLAAIFISAVPVSMFYTAAVYLPNFSYTQLSSSEALAFSCLAQFLCLILIPLLGYLGDRVGKSKQLFMASLFMVASPIIIFLSYDLFNQMHFTVTYIIILSLFVSMYSGPGPALLTESFPVIGRCTGLGIGISIGEGIFGGLAPLICLETHKFYQLTAFSSFFISFIGALSLLGVLLTSSRIFDKFKLQTIGEIKLSS